MAEQSLKKSLHELCLMYVQEKIDNINSAMQSARDSANADTKSSMGDKYETTQAMMHLELENQSTQLAEANKLLKTLQLINPEEAHGQVALGALVVTNTAKYYLSVSAGKLIFDDQIYFAVSISSPIGQCLMDASPGDTIKFQNREIKILNIY